MNSWWRAFYGQLTPSECNDLIVYGLSHAPVQGTIGHGGKSVVNEDFRQSTVRWLRKDDSHLFWLYARMENLMHQANAAGFGFDISGFPSVQFTEYDGSKEGHYDWHVDNCWKRNTPYDRKLSMVIQLSKTEDYEGGKLELENDPFDERVFANQGDVIIFPSFNKHCVTPVTKGKRFSLVTWFEGPQFR